MFNKNYFNKRYYTGRYFKPVKMYILPPAMVGGGGGSVREKLVKTANISAALQLVFEARTNRIACIPSSFNVGVEHESMAEMHEEFGDARSDDEIILLYLNSALDKI